jgi:hypothetical protein
VREGARWHLFATGCHEGYTYDIVHAVAPTPSGPWRRRPPVVLRGAVGDAVCAPGVVADRDGLHLFVQETYNLLGGAVQHLVSTDGGYTFAAAETALASLPGTSEAGLYDAHPSVVDGERLLTYSGFSVVGEPDLHLARSTGNGWHGPWERLGPIVTHDDVPFHNPRGHAAYEWGLEGAQLVALPGGGVLLVAVCFLTDGAPGERQRAFLAVADEAAGPYTVLGPALDPLAYAGRGENGHATAAVHDGLLHLIVQHRDGDGEPWELLTTSLPVEHLRRLETVA